MTPQDPRARAPEPAPVTHKHLRVSRCVTCNTPTLAIQGIEPLCRVCLSNQAYDR